jgi:Tfp pilus assembly protein PilF
LSLKIIKINAWPARALLLLAAFFCVLAAWLFIKWNFANAVVSRLEADRPESKPVAEWLAEFAPDDPQTHYSAAVVLEKTFDPGDLERSHYEYETAAALSPNDYRVWVGLARSRYMHGDDDGAEAAFGRAIELAPNYSDVQWAYGNFLLRQDRADEGFVFISKAAATDPEYASPAVVIAMQLHDDDLARVRQILGDSETTNAAVAGFLAGQKRFDEAYDAWSRVPAESKLNRFKDLGDKLFGQMVVAKKFNLAARIAGEMNGDEKPTIGQIANGGFDKGVKLRNARLFEWQIGEGAEPQIGLSDAQKHSGNYSLWMAFNTFETADFRPIEQTVPVEGGGQYEFEVFYRSDLKSPATLKWEIIDAVTLATLATTPAIVPSADWTPLKAVFTVPGGSDGVTVRLLRTGCNGSSCPMNGRLAFDDLSLRRL